ncbi:LysR family transcriptional regulator [Streptomyces sp. V2]|uniref:LysR family transcriptional regulator n=1 Tax=Streptomyces TaxID=1883 RepID=UPI0006EB8F5F|nr:MULTISPECIES: LysR family transcriptional regulator [Streptomyces]PWG13408.1 LysR family transcriptional regulator [Streptomyces sp. V2]
MIDLRRLTVLRAIAHYGTVTAAAASLHLTPSAASQHVRRLSRELEVPLLEPHGRRVRLTPAARVLLRHADRLENYWQRAEAELAATKAATLQGTLRLVGFPTAISVLLAPAAAQLQRDWPQLTVTIREVEPRDCFDLLFSGDADLAVVEATVDNPPLSDERFEQHALFDDPFELLTLSGHRLAGRPTVTVQDLATEPWIVGFPGSSARQLILAACNSAGFTPAIAHQAREWSTVASLVAHRLGIALVPQAASLPPDPDLARTPLSGSARPTRRFLSVLRSGSGDHPAIATAAALLDSLVPRQGRPDGP